MFVNVQVSGVSVGLFKAGSNEANEAIYGGQHGHATMHDTATGKMVGHRLADHPKGFRIEDRARFKEPQPARYWK